MDYKVENNRRSSTYDHVSSGQRIPLPSTTLRITRRQLELGAWQEVVGLLVGLMEPPSSVFFGAQLRRHSDAINAKRGTLTVAVDGEPGDPLVRRFFRALDEVWPLWSHFTSLDAYDESMYFIVAALTADGDAFTPQSVEAFIEKSKIVLRDFYMVYDVPGNLDALENDVRAYFDSRPAPDCVQRH